MLFIQSHTGDITIEAILEASSRLTVFSIPNVYRSLTRDIELKPDRREKRAQDRIIIRGVGVKRLLIFKDFKNPTSNNQPSMLRDHSHTGDLINIINHECLHLTVILDVPNIDHSLCVACDEALETCWAIDSN
jgi:hypothetical protein